MARLVLPAMLAAVPVPGSAASADGNPIIAHDARHLVAVTNAPTRLRAYQELHALVCLQGIVSRQEPRLKIRCVPAMDSNEP